MGAGASTEGAGGAAEAKQRRPAQQPSPPPKKPKPSRESATRSSLHLAADLVRHGVEAEEIEVTVEGSTKASFKSAGFMWGDETGLYCGKTRHGKKQASMPWAEAGLGFSVKSDTLTLSAEGSTWRVRMTKKPNIANWLACYLHVFLPTTTEEYSTTFNDWGRLGIAFAMYLDVVIPVVFTVDQPAAGLGVTPGSVLVSLNDTKISDLNQTDNMLDFISNAQFPKVCVFARPSDAKARLIANANTVFVPAKNVQRPAQRRP